MTCGGLCPGLNDVVQNIVFTLADYGGFGWVWGVCWCGVAGGSEGSASFAIVASAPQLWHVGRRAPSVFEEHPPQVALGLLHASFPAPLLLLAPHANRALPPPPSPQPGVPEDQILGIRYGLRGFYDRSGEKPVPLTRRVVDGIHLKGGTMLVGGGARQGAVRRGRGWRGGEGSSGGLGAGA